jgi:hypothetical protein
MHVAGEVYGPVLSCSALSLSTFCSAHAIAPLTAVLTPWTTSETMLAAVGVSSVVLSVLSALPSETDPGYVEATGIVSRSWWDWI